MLKGLGEASVSPFACRSFHDILRVFRPDGRPPVLRFPGFLYLRAGKPSSFGVYYEVTSMCLLCVERGCREVSPFSFMVTINFYKKIEIFDNIKFYCYFCINKTNIQNFLIATQ